MGLNQRRHLRRKPVTVDRQSTSRWHLMAPRHRHDQRTGPAHFLVQQPHGILLGIIGTEGIGAHQFGQPFRFVGIGFDQRPHFVDDYRNASLRRLPSRLAARHAAADDVDVLHGAGVAQALWLFQFNCACCRLGR